MKDQYVGDVNDYLKYAVLRAWTERGLSPGLAWMRTEPDLRTDGGLTRYLSSPGLFRDLDPGLFNGLARIVGQGDRNVRAVVDAGLVLNHFSYEALLHDGRVARAEWFTALAPLAEGPKMLFLDPDNGLEIASVARGQSGSRRYVFLEELRTLHDPGQAVCVYQHFPRVNRQTYLDGQLSRLDAVWPGGRTFAVCSPRIALLVSAPPRVAEDAWSAARDVVDRDPGGVGAWIHER